MKLELDESRRLTGPNLLWNFPGAIIDVFVDEVDKHQVAQTWQNQAKSLCDELGWTAAQSTYRIHTHGISMAISAPMDALYTACELAQHAWEIVVAELRKEEHPDKGAIIAKLKEELQREVNPKLLQIIQCAHEKGVTCITDDDYLSLGMGATVDTWPVKELPDSDAICWSKYQDVPLAFITGTNGKSTSVRLAAQIAKCAGLSAGVTSTDFIKVGEHIIDTGDYSGPGGARMLVRDSRTEIAFLEVARGGILRRGLPVNRVDAALVTNVAADHLGQYGIDTVEELSEAKFVVAKGLDNTGTLVLNADNELSVAQSQHYKGTICWFSESENNYLVQENLTNGEPAVFSHRGDLVYFNGKTLDRLCAIDSVPMTFGGHAHHNIQNALGVIGLCFALGFERQHIIAGLQQFASNAQDNPGRGNLYDINEAKYIVDFAHNEHSMKAVVAMASKIPATQRIVMFGHAGDRTDAEIQHLTEAVAGLDAEIYITSEVGKYLRGREPGEVPGLSKHFLMQTGIEEDKILFSASPLAGAQMALELAKPGTVVLLFTLCDREAVQQLLEQQPKV
ncbi:Mur ligase family protein [Planctobacterium marinum]|uniref:Mur ligase n=1 Tax=Planctobacterium marinum TaxID=1631968 RepID=A0AA48KR43_9ALTE|nr:Mur ligase [Planctobacterium marinum]